VIEEGYFKGASNDLSYACSLPDRNAKGAGVLFVHAEGGNRLGPHRMFVELAQRLNKSGFPTLRFDLSGCGDSRGQPSQNSIDSDIHDVMATVEFFKSKANLSDVYLLGISRGAHLCFKVIATATISIAGGVLLSTYVSTKKAAAAKFRNRLTEYFCKLKNPSYLGKLFSGRANMKQIVKTLADALLRGKRHVADPPAVISHDNAFFLIYGQNDPIAAESKVHYEGILDSCGASYETVIIPQANHSFFHYMWKERILEMVEEWLNKTDMQGGNSNE